MYTLRHFFFVASAALLLGYFGAPARDACNYNYRTVVEENCTESAARMQSLSVSKLSYANARVQRRNSAILKAL